MLINTLDVCTYRPCPQGVILAQAEARGKLRRGSSIRSGYRLSIKDDAVGIESAGAR